MSEKKVLTNLEIAELLRTVAAAYELKDEKNNKFRIVAYERAADAVEHASSELKDLWDEGKLDDIPGIGPGIAEHLDDLFRNGHSKHFDEILKGLPSSIFKLMELPGIGVKTAFKLVTNLKISDKSPLQDLEKHAKMRKIENLEGFGKESQKDILNSVHTTSKKVRRHLLPYASQIAWEITEWMNTNKDVLQIEPLGSLRRKSSTVGDIDIAVATNNPKSVLNHFVNYPKAHRIIEKGTISSSLVVGGGVQVDIMVQPPDHFGSLLQHFTGSKHHNVALREFALKKNLSLSEKGIKDLKSGKLLKMKSEEEFYNYLGLPWIPPEIREGVDEIKAALEHKIPKLVQLNEVVADLQIHSNYDIETSHDVGQSSMDEIIEKANSLGYEYIAFTEHNPSHSKHTEKQITDILKRKRDLVDKLNSKIGKGRFIKAFNSLEIDILPDGSLPVSDSAMETLDFALVSIHSSFDQDKRKMTERIIRGLSHPKVKIFAHPSGRLLQKRESVEANWREIFEFAVKNNKWMEINADPMRLDLPDFLVKEAKKNGVKFTLGTDAHHKDSMNNMEWGIAVARRGWLTAENVINTLSLKAFKEMILLDKSEKR